MIQHFMQKIIEKKKDKLPIRVKQLRDNKDNQTNI